MNECQHKRRRSECGNLLISCRDCNHYLTVDWDKFPDNVWVSTGEKRPTLGERISQSLKNLFKRNQPTPK